MQVRLFIIKRTSAGKNKEKRKHLHSVDGNVISVAINKNKKISQKKKNKFRARICSSNSIAVCVSKRNAITLGKETSDIYSKSQSETHLRFHHGSERVRQGMDRHGENVYKSLVYIIRLNPLECKGDSLPKIV